MGIKEDIERLEAEKNAALAMEERKKQEKTERSQQEMVHAQELAAEEKAKEHANLAFTNAVDQTIIIPVLLELAQALGEGKTSKWSLVQTGGIAEWTYFDSGLTKNPYPKDDYDDWIGCDIPHIKKDKIKGRAIVREVGVTNKVIQKAGLFRKGVTQDFINYDVIFIGIQKDVWKDLDMFDRHFISSLEGEGVDIHQLTNFRRSEALTRKDDHNSYLGYRVFGSQFEIPEILPASLHESISSLGDTNSQMYQAIYGPIKKGLLEAVRELPEFRQSESNL